VELLLPVGIVLLFWLFIIRPASRRQKELGRLQSSLSVGDEVVLTSGVFGTIHEMDDERLGIEVADGVVIQVARGAIGSKVERHEDSDDSDEPADELTDEQADDTAVAEADETKPGTGPEEN
jgi:preprotein translocase subunit YajC